MSLRKLKQQKGVPLLKLVMSTCSFCSCTVPHHVLHVYTCIFCVSLAIRALTRRPTVVESLGEADNSISLYAFCPLGPRFASRAR